MAKFGLKHFNDQTPQIIIRLQRALNFFFAGLLPFVDPLSFAFKTNSAVISMVIGIALLFVNTMGMFFGIEVTGVGTKEADPDSNG